MNLPKIPEDKANHMVYGSLLGLLAVGVSLLLGQPPVMAALHALTFTTAVGALKELSDRVANENRLAVGLPTEHEVELNDFLATVAGSVPVAAAVAAAGVMA
jgi:hypothetical protein